MPVGARGGGGGGLLAGADLSDLDSFLFGGPEGAAGTPFGGSNSSLGLQLTKSSSLLNLAAESLGGGGSGAGGGSAAAAADGNGPAACTVVA